MDFSINEKQKMLRRMTREFAEQYIVPVAEESDRILELDKNVFNMMKKMNYFGICIPKEYGGAGLHDDTIGFAIIVEEIGRVDASWSITVGVHCSVVAKLAVNSIPLGAGYVSAISDPLCAEHFAPFRSGQTLEQATRERSRVAPLPSGDREASDPDSAAGASAPSVSEPGK